MDQRTFLVKFANQKWVCHIIFNDVNHIYKCYESFIFLFDDISVAQGLLKFMKAFIKIEKRVLLIWAVVLFFGLVIGFGAYTFWYAKGFSYLSDRPEACMNCHVMNGVYSDWLKGGHQHVAKCNDCHVPHDFVGKWMTKANNGWHHSVRFTMGDVPVNIRATSGSKSVVQQNCIRCHSGMASHAIYGGEKNSSADALSCVSCHRQVGHAH